MENSVKKAFLKLEGIGKIYVSEGAVSVGIRGVSLEFERGEFVAVTGKSGSGKSTLLNTISGIDTYEEGELYVEGEPTSHYRQPEWEKYREKYISFIFQDYNIIDSFTVLQNVELALMHIDSKRERRPRALELIGRVGLTAQKRQKGSRLSGGQKQRTVIARALAKDSPIILADEPCGNLDSQTAEEIIKLLYEVSRDKLLIMVTHNSEEVDGYATRHIRVFDGRIESDIRTDTRNLSQPTHKASVKEESDLEDKGLTKGKKPLKRKSALGRAISVFKKGLSLGIANFATKPKLTSFLCMLSILASLGMTVMTSSTSSSIAKIFDRPTMFSPVEGRLVLARRDGAPITDGELEALARKHGATNSLRYDFLLDYKGQEDDIYTVLMGGSYYFDTPTLNVLIPGDWEQELNARIRFGEDYGQVIGRYPEKEGEVLLRLPLSYLASNTDEELMDSFVLLGLAPLDVVGLSFYADNNITPTCLLTREGYESLALVSKLPRWNFSMSVTVSAEDMGDHYYSLSSMGIAWGEEGVSVCTSDFDDLISSFEKSYTLRGDFNSESYSYNGELTRYTTTFGEDDFREEMELHPIYENMTWNSSPDFIIGSKTVEKMVEDGFGRGYTQASLLYSSDADAVAAIDGLKSEGYTCILSSYEYSPDAITTLFSLIGGAIMAVALVLTVVFLAFFIYICSLRALSATGGEIAIMRSMGIPKVIIKTGMYVRMALCFIPGALTVTAVAVLISFIPMVNNLFSYLYLWQYLLVLLCIFAISLRVTSKQMKKLFDKSVKTTLRGGDKA